MRFIVRPIESGLRHCSLESVLFRQELSHRSFDAVITKGRINARFNLVLLALVGRQVEILSLARFMPWSTNHQVCIKSTFGCALISALGLLRQPRCGRRLCRHAHPQYRPQYLSAISPSPLHPKYFHLVGSGCGGSHKSWLLLANTSMGRCPDCLLTCW
jgi:hypothetical protein